MQMIKDRSGFCLGYYRDDGSRVTLLSREFFVLGYYDKQNNITKDRTGFVVGRGNILGSLLTR